MKKFSELPLNEEEKKVDTILIEIRFDDGDDQENFEETFGLKKNKGAAQGRVKIEDLPQIIEDLNNVYGVGASLKLQNY